MGDCPDCGSAPTGVDGLWRCGTDDDEGRTIRSATCLFRECQAKLVESENELARFREQQGKLRALCQDLVGEETLHQDGTYETEMRKLRQELTDAKAVITGNQGGETPGDTLIRLSGLVHKVRTGTRAVTTEDWCSWLNDFGEKLNGLFPEADLAAGGDDAE